MSSTVENKVTIVTGASSGFGAATARLFAAEGAKTVLAARRIQRLEALAEEIRSAGGEALPIACDVTVQEQIDNLVKATLDAYGRIDILVNNAGIGRLNWLDELSPDDISREVDVDLKGAILMARAVLPSMLAQRSGHIINMVSVVGWVAPPLATVYSATKFGLRGFTEGLRREVAPFGIHVSAIYPAGARTEFSQNVGGELAARILNSRWVNSLTADDVAKAVLHVAKHPRKRSVILPWWYGILLWFNSHFPGVSDMVQAQLVRRYRKDVPSGHGDDEG